MHYGRTMAISTVLIQLPLLAGVMISVMRPAYASYALLGGVVSMICITAGGVMYGTIKSRGLQRIGLTLQYVDGSDDWFDIIYRDMPVDLGEKEGKKVYRIKTISGEEWLFQLDHPLDEVLPRFDDVPIAGFPVPVLTRFVTGVSVSENTIRLPSAPKSTLDRIKRVLTAGRKADTDNSTRMREVYAYATPVAVKQRKALIPDFSGVRSLFPVAVNYTIAEIKKENEQLQDHLADLQKMLDNHLPITFKVKDVRLDTPNTFHLNRKLVVVAAAAVIVVALVLVLRARGAF